MYSVYSDILFHFALLNRMDIVHLFSLKYYTELYRNIMDNLFLILCYGLTE